MPSPHYRALRLTSFFYETPLATPLVAGPGAHPNPLRWPHGFPPSSRVELSVLFRRDRWKPPAKEVVEVFGIERSEW